jgi:rhodanese-related sulfurtransferase
MSWRREVVRLCWLTVGPAALGLLVNAVSRQPVPLLSPFGPGAWPDRVRRITAEELHAALGQGRGILLVDVRSEADFAAGHPEQAVHVAAPSLAESYGASGLSSMVKAAREVVVLCENSECPAADRAARILRDLGNPQVRVLDGGWQAYQRSGMPLVRP